MPLPPKLQIRGLHASSSFRMALCFGFLVLGILSSTFTVYYIEIVGKASQQLNEFALHTHKHLLQVYASEGSDALRQSITRLLNDDIDTGSEFLVLQDKDGHVLAGNAAVPLAQIRFSAMPQDVWISHDQQPLMARMLVHDLGQGQVLLVGSNLQPLIDIRNRYLKATGVAFVLVLLLALVAALTFRRLIKQRSADLRRAMHQAGQGNLQFRLSITSPSDEIGLLEQDINTMLEQLERHMHGIRHISNMVAHNLRTPLNRTLHHIQAALEGPEALRFSQLELAQEELQTLSRLFAKMLLIAEMESGVGQQNFERIQPASVLQEVLEYYAPVFQDRRVLLTQDLQHAMFVQGDAHLLANALSNLLDNFLKYGADPSGNLQLHIGLKAEKEHMVLRLRDFGQGVPEEALPRMGQHFFRAAPHQQLPGHGLGLASLQAITRLHYGSITWRNANPGLETCITLPLAPPPSTADEPPPPSIEKRKKASDS